MFMLRPLMAAVAAMTMFIAPAAAHADATDNQFLTDLASWTPYLVQHFDSATLLAEAAKVCAQGGADRVRAIVPMVQADLGIGWTPADRFAISAQNTYGC
jgi:hypothetical protein